MNKYSKGPALSRAEGFTIIELIVVIAIIAVLAGIVLVNVTQYINKGKIAAIKGTMAGLRTTAATYFETNSDYADICSTSGFTSSATAIVNAGSPNNWCFDSVTKAGECETSQWTYITKLPDSTFWCVDYLGNSTIWTGTGDAGCDCTRSPDTLS